MNTGLLPFFEGFFYTKHEGKCTRTFFFAETRPIKFREYNEWEFPSS